MAKLARALIVDLPRLYPLYSERSFTYNNITQHNRNSLLRDRSMNVDGMKTGYTSGAGYSLVSSATQGDRRLIAVVMGSSTAQSRAAESKQLLNYGFRFFDTIEPHKTDETVFDARIWMGKQNTLALGVSEPVFLTVPSGAGNQVRAEMNIDEQLRAPIKQGSIIGEVAYLDGNGETLKSVNLIAMEDVERGGILKRILDWFKMLFI
jgi:D-alanyl-D-alanine carboxypeptidase (penicillin-binding protein 5/6)